MIQLTRYNRRTGALIGTLTANPTECESTFRLYGGCDDLRLTLPWIFGDALPVSSGEEITVVQDELPLFSGVVDSVEPSTDGTVFISAHGWHKELNSISLVPFGADRLSFGVAPPDNAPKPLLFHPSITTVQQVFEFLRPLIVEQSNNRLSIGDYNPHPYSTKLCGEFCVYAADKLFEVLDKLATMDNAVFGIGPDRGIYWRHRDSITSGHVLQVRGDVPDTWRADQITIGTEATFAERSGAPTQVVVMSRDIDGQPAVRRYRDITDPEAPTRRVVWQARGIRTGPQARRAAIGVMKRYAAPIDLDVRSLKGISAPKRFDPHLGTVAVYDRTADETMVVGLAESVVVSWVPFVAAEYTIGANEVDPGSGGPNDPIATAPETDDPGVDTGTGTEELPVPSDSIDFDDGFDGDGDDLHQNPDRDFPTDPGGLVDYGTDIIDPTNRPVPSASSGGFAALDQRALVYAGKVTALDLTGETPLYNVELYRADGELLSLASNDPAKEPGKFVCADAWPVPPIPYALNTKVWCHFPVLDGGEPPGLVEDPPYIIEGYILTATNQPISGVQLHVREALTGRIVAIETNGSGKYSAKTNGETIRVRVVAWPFQEAPTVIGGDDDTTFTFDSGTHLITATTIVAQIATDNAPKSLEPLSAFNFAPRIMASFGDTSNLYPLGVFYRGVIESHLGPVNQ